MNTSPIRKGFYIECHARWNRLSQSQWWSPQRLGAVLEAVLDEFFLPLVTRPHIMLNRSNITCNFHNWWSFLVLTTKTPKCQVTTITTFSTKHLRFEFRLSFCHFSVENHQFGLVKSKNETEVPLCSLCSLAASTAVAPQFLITTKLTSGSVPLIIDDSAENEIHRTDLIIQNYFRPLPCAFAADSAREKIKRIVIIIIIT